MVNFLGLHVGKSQKENTNKNPTDDKYDKLQKQIHADNKLAKLLEEITPYLQSALTPQWFVLPDKMGRPVRFDNVAKRMEAADYCIFRIGVFARGGSRPKRKFLLTQWRLLYAEFKVDLAAMRKELWRRFQNDIPELSRKWREFVDYVETQYLPGLGFVWDDIWQDEDVAPAMTIFIQEAPNFMPMTGRDMRFAGEESYSSQEEPPAQ